MVNPFPIGLYKPKMPNRTELVAISCLLSSIPLVTGLPTARAMQCCAEIAAKSHVNTQSWPVSQFSSDYTYEKSHYWSNANADAIPACVVLPTNAQEVSAVIQILLKYPDVGFATKSGGHNANVGVASSDGGVLISMSQLNSITLSSDRKQAYLSPGARWMDAVGVLEPYNLTVVGGRLGDVGVGGLLIGCGLSFLSAQYGLPCDNSKL